jgi:hypothetical protein
MQTYDLRELVMDLFKKPKPKPKSLPENFNMNAEQDAFDIWSKAGLAGMEKYRKGNSEHKTEFWTAGAGWYAANLKDEQLDLISYLHHLTERIKTCQMLAKMMADDEVSLRDAATLLNNLVSDNAPNASVHQSND